MKSGWSAPASPRSGSRADADFCQLTARATRTYMDPSSDPTNLPCEAGGIERNTP